MTEKRAQIQQLLAEAAACLKHGKRRKAIQTPRQPAGIATTLALPLKLHPVPLNSVMRSS